MQTESQEIKNLISKNKWDKAIAALFTYDENFHYKMKGALDLVNKDYMNNKISLSDKNQTLSLLTDRIFLFLDKYDASQISNSPKTQDIHVDHLDSLIEIQDNFVRKMEQCLMDKKYIPTNGKYSRVALLTYYLLEEITKMTELFQKELESFNSEKMGAKEKLLNEIASASKELEKFEATLHQAYLKEDLITEIVCDCIQQCTKLRKEIIQAFTKSSKLDLEVARCEVYFNRLEQQLKEKMEVAVKLKFSDS
ncbi:MAG: hypothetical protein KDD15_11805 [Lewinella sp.]|nr:hypothetical protein [Lewinella sp.]